LEGKEDAEHGDGCPGFRRKKMAGRNHVSGGPALFETGEEKRVIGDQKGEVGDTYNQRRDV
jgi:hypothetical protein